MPPLCQRSASRTQTQKRTAQEQWHPASRLPLRPDLILSLHRLISQRECPVADSVSLPASSRCRGRTVRSLHFRSPPCTAVLLPRLPRQLGKFLKIVSDLLV